VAKPIIILNCKTYPQATGTKAVKLAKLLAAAGTSYRADVRIAVQPTDIALVAAAKIPVYAQHIDPVLPGKTTGWITAAAVKAAGASGVLLNHSEHRLTTKELETAVRRCKEHKLKSVVCAESVARLKELQHIPADLFAVEPPELIGGDVSVSTARPGIISESVKASRKPVLVGAGIKDAVDIAVARKRGAVGVLLASSITLAKDQKGALRKLLQA
jgi:triosephosphate isomerase